MLKNDLFIKNIICILVIYITCSYLITYTIYENFVLRQIITIGILFSLFILNKCRKTKFNSHLFSVWFPFTLYIIVNGLFNSQINSSIFWMICIFLLSLSEKYELYKYIPIRLITYMGIILFAGQLIQIFIPSFYFSHISNIFTTSHLIMQWHHHIGFAGFTFQIGLTGGLLLIAEAAAYALFKTSTDVKERRLYLILIIIFVLGVFLTGKRTFSFLAIFLPFCTNIIIQKSSPKKLFKVIFISLIGFFIYFLLKYHPELFKDINGLNRIASSIGDVSVGEDISNGRFELYDSAWKAFEADPIIGVGVGRFISATNSETAVHNAYLTILCEMGVIGFIFYIIPLLVSTFYSVKVIKSINVPPATLIFAMYYQLFYLIYSFTGNTTIDLWGYVFYFLSLATIMSYKNFNLIR